MENIRGASTRDQGAPARHYSIFVSSSIVGFWREAGWLNVSPEGDFLTEGEDGVVIVGGLCIVGGVVSDRAHLQSLLSIRGSQVMFPKQNPGDSILGAVGSSQDLLVADQGAPTEGSC